MDYKSVLSKLIDEKGLMSLIMDDVLEGVVKKKLDELVLDSENKLDDALVGMIYPILKEEMEKFLSEKMAELLAPEAP